MGVFLNLDIAPYRVTPEAWKKVYNETLQLLEEFDFLDKEVADNGYYYAMRTKHRENVIDGYSGWQAIGDTETGANMENFFFIEDLDFYRNRLGSISEPYTNTDDILLGNLPEEITRSGPATVGVWFSKTQGMPAHTYLLATACLVCHRFPMDAIVYGDITAAQCREAVEWANNFLSEPIDVPVTADAARLMHRLVESSLPADAILSAFDELSLELDNVEKGEVIKQYIPNDEIKRHYRKVLIPECPRENEPKIENYRLKEFLALGLDFKDLCHMVLADPVGNKLEVREFLKLLIEMKLHVPMEEKVLTDYASLATSGGPGEIDNVSSMMMAALFAMKGGGNRNVRAYLPLDEILDAIHEVTGAEGLDQMVAELQAEYESSDKYEVQSRVYDGEDSYVRNDEKKKAEEQAHRDALLETYDIARGWQAINFKEGCTVEPELDKTLLNYARQLRPIGEEAFKGYLRYRGPEGRKGLFLTNYRILMPKEVQDYVFERVMDEAFITRYIALFAVEVNDRNKWAIRAFLWNPALWEHYWNRAAIPEESEVQDV